MILTILMVVLRIFRESSEKGLKYDSDRSFANSTVGNSKRVVGAKAPVRFRRSIRDGHDTGRNLHSDWAAAVPRDRWCRC